ncbi:hypothetical protein NZD89_27250 [Alicyclobacillus fastidiosus]|uniref:Uncharacterized protein n=1 Tax=Alicyclobacillus fastidiosus TaxID=392011 RepID=A0ABY6ZG23_9BACL|nr:hypothetical protein [Alicyclobacillus fastidiosus]WAH41854.1 hypothetical protein NZD89_27250 [Alicyclobacillus fastidiosus]GMA63558.1 hypothetical protein GCM10025859_39980 [Alicyclobacillus fastidiosus]
MLVAVLDDGLPELVEDPVEGAPDPVVVELEAFELAPDDAVLSPLAPPDSPVLPVPLVDNPPAVDPELLLEPVALFPVLVVPVDVFACPVDGGVAVELPGAAPVLCRLLVVVLAVVETPPLVVCVVVPEEDDDTELVE